jgi:hypothetical protein
MTLHRFIFAGGFLALGLSITACGQEAADAVVEGPATVEEIGDTELKRITLTAQAAERLDIQTAAVGSATQGGDDRLTVPHGAIVWDADGTTWTYTMTDELVFVRAPITLDRIEGDQAFLVDGPDEGSLVVVVGAAELWGTEHGVGGEGH